MAWGARRIACHRPGSSIAGIIFHGLGAERREGAYLDGTHSWEVHDGAVTADVCQGALVAVPEGIHPIWELHARLDSSLQQLGKELPLHGKQLRQQFTASNQISTYSWSTEIGKSDVSL